MSDSIIIAVAVLIALYLFRGSLSRFFLRAGPDGLETELEAYQTDAPGKEATDGKSIPNVNISGNKLLGRKNKIDVGQEDVGVQDNLLVGEKEEIVVRSESQKKKKKK